MGKNYMKEENKCPECGKWKSEDYDYCYECHEEGIV